VPFSAFSYGTFKKIIGGFFMRKKMSLQALIETAIMAGLAYVLDILPSVNPTPNISISFAMVPIFLLAFRWGMTAGFAGGFLWGLLQVITGDAYILTPLQGFIEYFVAFSCIGFAGVLKGAVQKSFREGNWKGRAWLLFAAVFIGSFARYFWHFIAGFIFWAEASSTLWGAIVYSFVINGMTMLGSALFCYIVLILVLGTAPRLLTQSVK